MPSLYILSYMIEIASMRSALDYLVEEVRSLKAQSQSSQSSQSSLPELTRTQSSQSSGRRSSQSYGRKRAISVLPESLGSYNPERNSLEKMTSEQYKNFRVL